jgi:alkylated DNA nucleotide flippase Atl1
MSSTQTLDATETPWWRIVDIEPSLQTLETMWLQQNVNVKAVKVETIGIVNKEIVCDTERLER